MRRTSGYLLLVFVLVAGLGVVAGCGDDTMEVEDTETTEALDGETETTEALDEDTETTEAGMEDEAAGDEATEAVSGAEVFATNCASCHGQDGTGGANLPGPDLTEEQNEPREEVAEQVREGGGGMPAFEDQLSEEEIEAVVDFVHGGMEE